MIGRLILFPLAAITCITFLWFIYKVFTLGVGNFFKPKKTNKKILVLIDKTAEEPVLYASEVDTNINSEIRAAINVTQVPFIEIKDDVDKIAELLDNDMYYWINDRFCIDIFETTH